MPIPMTRPANADAPAMRAQIERLLEGGDRISALAAARRYWESSPDASVARYVRRLFEPLWQGRPTRVHRVAMLRSFTVEPVIPLLEAEAALVGVRLDAWVCPFNAYAQEILNPASELYAHRPDSVILAVQTRDVAPALWERFAEMSPAQVEAEIDGAANLLIDLLGRLRGGTDAHILCHGLEAPGRAADGLLELDREFRQADAIEAVNRRLRGWCAGQRDVHLLDYDGLIARCGRDRWSDAKKWATARLPLSIEAMSWLARDWWRHLAVWVLPPAKVLALDLDNTLWGGVLGEEGLNGLHLGDEHPGAHFRAFQRAVLDIARHPDMLIRRKDLAAWRINWDPKPANLVSLAAELNLGLDAIIFADDNPAECEAVRRALPEVDVVELGADPSTYAGIVRALPRLERLTLSAEDAERTRYYADERGRRELQGAAESVEDFLASLQIEVTVEPITAATLARAAQLTQKTNQLNMTTRRYSETELATHLQTPGGGGFVLRSRDRFGDSGIVGLALTRSAAGDWEIDTLLLSCRVIGRQIETALVAHLAQAARAAGAERLVGWFRPSGRNAPAADIYRIAGLELLRRDADAELWGLDLAGRTVSPPSWVRMVEPEPVGG
jgi:FkbH-like protein